MSLYCFGNVPLVAGLFYGIKPAVTAIVVQATHRIGSRALKGNAWAIAAASFVAIFALNVPFPLIVGVAALVGYVGGRVWPQSFLSASGHGAADKSYGAAIIDDNTPTPPHALFATWKRLAQVGIAAAVLWDRAYWATLRQLRLGPPADANELVLYQGGLAHLWRCLCRVALCIPRRSHTLRLAHTDADD